MGEKNARNAWGTDRMLRRRVEPQGTQDFQQCHPVDHLVPFQCRAWLRSDPPFLWLSPTAQQLAARIQRTLNSSLASPLAVPAGSGVATRDHVRPFQRRAWFTCTPVPLRLTP